MSELDAANSLEPSVAVSLICQGYIRPFELTDLEAIAQQTWVPTGFLRRFCLLSEAAVFAYKCLNSYARQVETSVDCKDPDVVAN
ncbi:dTDP-4-dehydrorhamnose 3,5-epimerase family protein [Algihabitans albus]|uniref:dTDP-4-dehydrorhamnose 3,5-epimerase family protein n=1 Tax=Algihabitans albus TaxID=2164067 RepID=UPI000E5C7C74|nr:dTDP-4-dehydrorhamnose 3,5-epimerase family protein [Algihabitans albus]